MAFVITLNFDHEINTSVQIGDNVYFSNPQPGGGFDVVNDVNPPVHAGTVYSIASPFEMEVYSEYEDFSLLPSVPYNIPGSGSYISFSKDGVVNQNELIGYYALVRLVNDSKTEAKLFSVATEVTENSK